MAKGIRAAAGISAAALIAAVGLSAQAAPGDVINIADPALAKPVGLAADPSRGVYWVTTSADQPGTVYAVDQAGQRVGSVSYPAVPQSPQALSMYQGLLHVADIGDPGLARANVQIHVLDGLGYGGSAGLVSYRLIYPDGPHDAKAFTVSPRGNFYLVTFGSPGRIYRATAPAPGTGTLQLSFVANAPDWVTDAVFVEPGKLAVRSYTGVQVLDAASDTFVPLASAKLSATQAGESLALSTSGDGLLADGWSTSEGQGAMLTQLAEPNSIVELPAAPSALPSAPVTPSTTPTPTPSRSASPSIRNARGVNSNTTIVAAAVGLAFAALMGGLAFRQRKHD